MIDRARALAARLSRLHADGLSVSFRLMPGESHASGVFEAAREMLGDAFGSAGNAQASRKPLNRRGGS